MTGQLVDLKTALEERVRAEKARSLAEGLSRMQAEEVAELLLRAEELLAQAEREITFYRGRMRELRAAGLRVQREMGVLRRERFSFTDERLLAAVRTTSQGRPVSASAIAATLFPDEPLWHSDIVRVGQALGRLARLGRVERREHPSRSCTWQASDA